MPCASLKNLVSQTLGTSALMKHPKPELAETEYISHRKLLNGYIIHPLDKPPQLLHKRISKAAG